MSYSSPSVTVVSLSLSVKADILLPIRESRLEAGLNMNIKTESIPAVATLMLSEYLRATLFGSISPKKKTTSVVIKVDTVTADKPKIRVTFTVTTEAAAR